MIVGRICRTVVQLQCIDLFQCLYYQDLAGFPSTTLYPLWRVLYAAVHLITGLGPRDHVTEQMKDFSPLVTNQMLYQFQVMSEDARHCDWLMFAIRS